jgi:hypothetical protein
LTDILKVAKTQALLLLGKYLKTMDTFSANGQFKKLFIRTQIPTLPKAR